MVKARLRLLVPQVLNRDAKSGNLSSRLRSRASRGWQLCWPSCPAVSVRVGEPLWYGLAKRRPWGFTTHCGACGSSGATVCGAGGGMAWERGRGERARRRGGRGCPRRPGGALGLPGAGAEASRLRRRSRPIHQRPCPTGRLCAHWRLRSSCSSHSTTSATLSVALRSARTIGPTPRCRLIRELLRRAALFAADDGSRAVGDAHLDAALQELVVEGGKLTHSLLGASAIGFQAP